MPARGARALGIAFQAQERSVAGLHLQRPDAAEWNASAKVIRGQMAHWPADDKRRLRALLGILEAPAGVPPGERILTLGGFGELSGFRGQVTGDLVVPQDDWDQIPSCGLNDIDVVKLPCSPELKPAMQNDPESGNRCPLACRAGETVMAFSFLEGSRQ
jgi:hypothetical protein